jgi:flagellar basal body P-ring formation protein FlgA
MIFRATVLLCCLAEFLNGQAASCATIESDRILVRDLATALPAFGAVPPETAIAIAPMPGVRRVLHASEIAALAQRYSVALAAVPDICFEWKMEPLNRTRVIAAMQTALGTTGTRIEISELSLYPVPHGTIEFVRERLGTPASYDRPAPVLWRGDVVYGGRRRFPIWSRVMITGPVTRIFASTDLKAGEPIQQASLRVETSEGFPRLGKDLLSAERIVGTLPLRAIAAGAEIRMNDLSRPSDVNRGEPVEVEVQSGAARLVLTATAETSGRSGDTISVRNRESKKLFQARVSGKGKAVVQGLRP